MSLPVLISVRQRDKDLSLVYFRCGCVGLVLGLPKESHDAYCPNPMHDDSPISKWFDIDFLKDK